MPVLTSEGAFCKLLHEKGGAPMQMVAIEGRKEEPMSPSVTINDHESGDSLRFWRIVVFGSIGLLYLISLFVPSLREALAQVFSYFPR
jgi:hypothetical protein